MQRVQFCFVLQTVLLLSPIHAEKDVDSADLGDGEKSEEAISASLKLADEENGKNRTNKVREIAKQDCTRIEQLSNDI